MTPETHPMDPASRERREWHQPYIREWDIKAETRTGPNGGTVDGFIYS